MKGTKIKGYNELRSMSWQAQAITRTADEEHCFLEDFGAVVTANLPLLVRYGTSSAERRDAQNLKFDNPCVTMSCHHCDTGGQTVEKGVQKYYGIFCIFCRSNFRPKQRKQLRARSNKRKKFRLFRYRPWFFDPLCVIVIDELHPLRIKHLMDFRFLITF